MVVVLCICPLPPPRKDCKSSPGPLGDSRGAGRRIPLESPICDCTRDFCCDEPTPITSTFNIEGLGTAFATAEGMCPIPRKIAISTWEGRVSPVFDVSRELIVFELCVGQLQARRFHTLLAADSLSKVAQLAELGVELLICGAISEPVKMAIEAQNISVLAFIAGETADVLNAFMLDGLSDYSMRMPGCGRHRRRRCRRHRAGPTAPPDPQKPTSEKD
jgi:predicted Fe-Mo cluster-binding NifX family protein